MFNRDAFQREECSGEDACKETKDALFGPRYLDSGKYRQALKRDHRGGGQRRLSSDRRRGGGVSYRGKYGHFSGRLHLLWREGDEAFTGDFEGHFPACPL